MLAPRQVHAQAQAQAVIACPPSQNQIIQSCASNDLIQFDSDSVQAWLAAHSLPPTDSANLFLYGRTDVRDEVRAFEFARLLDIVLRAPLQRTSHEQAVYNALQSQLWQHQQAQLQAAVADRNNWEGNPCAWRPDPDVANAYALDYDPAPFCVAQPFTTLFTTAPQAPTLSYFLAAAQKNTFGQILGSATGGAAIAADTGAKLLIALGFAASPSTAVASGTGTVVALTGAGSVPLSQFGMDAAASVAAGTAATGPLAMVQLAMATTGIAAFQPFQGQPTLDQLAQLDSMNAASQADPPDLAVFAKNQRGLYQLLVTFTEMTLPEFSSTTTLPSRGSSDLNFLIQRAGDPNSTESAQLPYADWNGARWFASAHGGWLVQTCFSANCTGSGSFSPTMDIVDGSGTKWAASRVGTNFLLTKQSPATTDGVCPASALTGLSNPADASKCSSLVVPALQLMSAYGLLDASARLTQPPAFTSLPTTTFTNGFAKAKTFTVTATGVPLPSITLASGSLPPGLSFSNSAVNGAGIATISTGSATLTNTIGGTGSLPPVGTYTIALQAQNSAGTVTQAFTIVVGAGLQITSPATAYFTYGLPGSFTIAAAGDPPIQFSYDPRILPAGLNFQDNGDGTATISGAALDSSVLPPCNVVVGGTCGITATDPETSVNQPFQIIVGYAPQPAIISSPTATFVSGRPNSFLVATSGAITPVDFSIPCGAPSWLSLQDNHDGTAMLSATPPIDPSVPTGIPTTYRLFIFAHAAGSGVYLHRGTPCDLYPPNLTFNVISIPMFTNADSTTFTAGQSGSALVSSNLFFGNPLVSYTGVLAGGTSFTPQHSAGTVAGTPVLSGALPTGGAGGDYPLTFSALGLGGLVNGNADSWQVVSGTHLVSATQQFDLRVNQPPAIISATDVNFTIGVPNTFTFLTTGFPQLPANGQPGMSMSYTGALPAGVTFSQVTPVGLSTGVFAVSGTPAASPVGPFSILLTANNGLGTAHQTFTVHVIKPGDVNQDGKVDCSDINVVKAAMGTYRDRIGYDYRADANNDGVVDARDLAYVTSYLPAGTACQ
jgi:hypothetical protein